MLNNNEHLLALDVSTKKTGIALFSHSGQLLELTHATFSGNNTFENFTKNNTILVDIIRNLIEKYNVTKCVIEEPLKGGNINRSTIVNLNANMAALHTSLSLAFDFDIDFITVNEARKYGMPEYKSLPKVIQNEPINNWNKYAIMYFMSKRFNNIVWDLNRNLTLDVANFDKADAICTGLGYMIKNGFWALKDFGDDNKIIEEAVEFVKETIVYQRLCKILKKDKNLSTKERKEEKKRYLREEFISFGAIKIPDLT